MLLLLLDKDLFMPSSCASLQSYHLWYLANSLAGKLVVDINGTSWLNVINKLECGCTFFNGAEYHRILLLTPPRNTNPRSHSPRMSCYCLLDSDGERSTIDISIKLDENMEEDGQ